jgi:hydroxymethylbilane synthase
LNEIEIGTRGSALAVTQSEWIKNRIEARLPGITVEIVRIKTKGDKILIHHWRRSAAKVFLSRR